MTPLETEYSPSSCVASIDDELAAYAAASAAAAATLPHRTIAYGPHPDERAIVFDGPIGAPLHVFIHGGYWQALGAADCLMMAPALVAAGLRVASIDYTLAPAASIGEMIDQCCRAVASLIDELHPTDTSVSGSSAGAHLAAHVAQHEPRVARAVLLSGVYRLAPLVRTYINEPLGLTAATAAQWSVDLERRPAAEVLVVHGSNETEAFKAQSALLAAAWAAPLVEVVGRNHFDLVFDLPALVSAASADAAWGLPSSSGAPTSAAGAAACRVRVEAAALGGPAAR
jgi:arylformamidase